MAIESVAAALNCDDPELTPTDRLVLVGIANHDGDGGSWPAIRTLARYSGVTTRTVQRSITKLEQRGHITRHQQQGGTHRTPEHGRPNLYAVHIQTMSGGDTHVTPPMTPTSPPTPDPHVTPPVTPMSPEPSLNHPSEPSSEKTLVTGRKPMTEFEEFWAAYPRRQGKATARQRWAKMTEPERMAAMDALWGWGRYYASVGEQFTPHASTWLNQRRWEDDIPAPARPEVSRKTASTRAAIARLRTVPDDLNIFPLDSASIRELG